jgi:hypothetical protein
MDKLLFSKSKLPNMDGEIQGFKRRFQNFNVHHYLIQARNLWIKFKPFIF